MGLSNSKLKRVVLLHLTAPIGQEIFDTLSDIGDEYCGKSAHLANHKICIVRNGTCSTCQKGDILLQNARSSK